MTAPRTLHDEARRYGEADAMLWGQMASTLGEDAMADFLRSVPRTLYRTLGLEGLPSLLLYRELIDAWKEEFEDTLTWLGAI